LKAIYNTLIALIAIIFPESIKIPRNTFP